MNCKEKFNKPNKKNQIILKLSYTHDYIGDILVSRIKMKIEIRFRLSRK